MHDAYTCTKTDWSVGSKDRRETNGRTDATDCFTFTAKAIGID